MPVGRPSEHIAVGMNSFALAARYGTPASYQHQGEYLQLNYGSAAAGYKVIVLAGRPSTWSAGHRPEACARTGRAKLLARA